MTENEFDINNVADQPAENVTETAEPTAEAIAETIADINTSAAVAVAPISAPAKKEKKRKKDEYRVSNFDIIRNYHRYTAKEKKHYKYLFWKRIASYVWPFFRALIIFGLSFVILYPILYMISTSIRPQSEMNDPSIMWIPKTIRFENFAEVWKAINYPGTIWYTMVLNIVSSVLQVATCALTGYGFARFKFKGKNFFFALVLLQIIVPVQIILIPQYSQFRYFDIFGLFNALTGDSLNLVGTNFAMYIPALMCNGIRAGLFIYLFRQFFRGLPKELEDAAYLDGCGPFKTFISVMVPNAASSFLTVFIFSIVWYWNDYYVSSMYFNDSNTIALKVNNITNIISMYLDNQVGVATDYVVWMEAACLLAIAPIVIMYIFLQKYFTEGIARAGLAN
ncbi:MAG: carbohydrate ABC transporter permease [Oscillospiraceae bacterium]|nr:carbohydrate ABC transporter permease [Oscillospiraceae bacterium]MDY4588106.1 carbohydrate ABC transporter permease [Oscillospiraceae bacterium]